MRAHSKGNPVRYATGGAVRKPSMPRKPRRAVTPADISTFEANNAVSGSGMGADVARRNPSALLSANKKRQDGKGSL